MIINLIDKKMEVEIVMKPQIKDTILSMKVGQTAKFSVPKFKIASVRNTVSELKKEHPELVYECTEKGVVDAIEVRRIK